MRSVALNTQTADGIDVYSVGVQYELGFAYNVARLGMWREAWGRLKRIPGMWGKRNAWNGYLAEPVDASRPFARAGHAWTRRRAVADLRRHMRAYGAREAS